MEIQKPLFEMALGMEEPLFISEIGFDKAAGELHIHIDFERGGAFDCPICGKSGCKARETTDKVWRHLNFFQYKCYLHFWDPSVKCDDCGTHLWVPAWARERSGFTLLFEAFLLTLATEMPLSDIADLVGEHDTRIRRVVNEHVEKARKAKDYSGVKRVGVDETSSKKGHNYVSVIMDMDASEVVYVTEGKSGEVLEQLKTDLSEHCGNAENITAISMDMSNAFISAATKHLPNATVTFDKFHVIKHINEAIDAVRRSEAKKNPILKNTRYIWLKNPQNLTDKQKAEMETLSKENTKTAKAYQLRLSFQDIYNNIYDAKSARFAIEKWVSWAIRSRLKPFKRVAHMVSSHIDGIVEYFNTRLTAGRSEGMNSRIQLVKRRARGFRNIRNFINMIYLEGANLVLPAWG